MSQEDDEINEEEEEMEEMEEMESVRTDTGEIREVVITNDQTELIKKTIAQGATDEELKLFFYDCLRRGVHPLDKLIHFTKRAGKYTPITSIDFMRARASETGDCAGIDDPVFAGEPLSSGFMATVTVWRYVKGHRCGFTASARWSEYCLGDKQNFMWSKMPYGQLGKCAEALALRKAFPQQIGNLYSHEEMEQSGSTTSQSPPLKPPKRKSEAGKSDLKNGTRKDGAKGKSFYYEFLDCMKKAKGVIGDEKYYTILGAHGFEHANNVNTKKQQDAIYQDMLDVAKTKTEMREPGDE